jgi:hypothetical protein
MSTKSFQVASVAHPIELQWAPSHYDQGKSARAIKCFVENDRLIHSIQDIDESLIKQDEHGRNILRLKVWQSARVQLHGSDDLLTVGDLQRGDEISLIVKIHNWSFEGKQGTSLTASHVLIVEQGSVERQYDETPVNWL